MRILLIALLLSGCAGPIVQEPVITTPQSTRGPTIPESDRQECPALKFPELPTLTETQVGLLLLQWYNQYRDCSGRHWRNLQILNKAFYEK